MKCGYCGKSLTGIRGKTESASGVRLVVVYCPHYQAILGVAKKD